MLSHADTLWQRLCHGISRFGISRFVEHNLTTFQKRYGLRDKRVNCMTVEAGIRGYSVRSLAVYLQSHAALTSGHSEAEKAAVGEPGADDGDGVVDGEDHQVNDALENRRSPHAKR